MVADERRKKILEILNKNGSVKASDKIMQNKNINSKSAVRF